MELGLRKEDMHDMLQEKQKKIVDLTARIVELERALASFVLAYVKHEEPIGESDLDDEQPYILRVTLGDCRKARRTLG